VRANFRRSAYVLAVVFSLIAVALPLAADAARAPRPVRFVEQVDEVIPDDPGTTDDDLCGIPVTTHVVGHATTTIRLNRNGFPEFTTRVTVVTTWTNEATGKSLVNDIRQVARDLSVVDNGDGTITVTYEIVGTPEWLKSPDGAVYLRDFGRIVFAAILDFNGTPSDPSDDIFITEEIVSITGPHPEADSDFSLFCQIVTDVLT
jgi:hypothetical protein